MDRIPSSLPQNNIVDQHECDNDTTVARTNARSSASISRESLVHPLLDMAMMMSVDPKDDGQEQPDDDADNDDGGDDQAEELRTYSHQKEPSAKRQRTSTGASASRDTATGTTPATVATTATSTPTTEAHDADKPTTEAHDADNIEINNKQPVHQEQWNEMLERLVAYKAKHGHCLVPKRYAEDPRLGTWVETQRVQVSTLPSFSHRQQIAPHATTGAGCFST